MKIHCQTFIISRGTVRTAPFSTACNTRMITGLRLAPPSSFRRAPAPDQCKHCAAIVARAFAAKASTRD